MAIKRIIASESDGPGIIAFDTRNKSDKRELYISDLPDETNTLIFRLQNIYSDDVILNNKVNELALEIVFPKGLFDESTALSANQVLLSKWQINRNKQLLSFDNTKQTKLKEAVQTLQKWQFLKYDGVSQVNQDEPGIGIDLKEALTDYFKNSLEIKTELKDLFKNYLVNSTRTNDDSLITGKISNFPELAKLYEKIAELNQEVEENIKDLVTFRTEFQQQSEQSKALLQKVIKDSIESHLGKMSETSIFLIDDEKLKAIDTINAWFEQLKLDDNLINMLSEHQKVVDNWTIKTKFEAGQQHISISAADIESVRLKPYEYFVIEIKDFNISKKATIANNIEIKYPNAVIAASQTLFKNQFSQTTSLDVLNHAGKKLPLHIALAPNQGLFNDDPANSILINLTNIGLETMKIVLPNISIFMNIAQENGHFPTAFIEKDKTKAMNVNAINNITSHRTITTKSKPVGDTDPQAKNKAITWNSGEVELAPNKQFQIKLSKIVTGLPEGIAPLTIRIKGVSGFKDEDFRLEIERKPERKLPDFKIIEVKFLTTSVGDFTYTQSVEIDKDNYQLMNIKTDKEVAYIEVKNQDLVILKTTRQQESILVTLFYINKEFIK